MKDLIDILNRITESYTKLSNDIYFRPFDYGINNVPGFIVVGTREELYKLNNLNNLSVVYCREDNHIYTYYSYDNSLYRVDESV